MLLHDADQGAVQPEVRRPGRAGTAPTNVGLLTGDNTVNGEAPVVVMTTEVLRNMLYAGSSTLRGLGYVVMDEVHYLSDRFRGAVWEEVIIHLPESVRLVSLSATVSNAEEFGDWLVTVRGRHRVVVEEHRPVPLWQHVMVGNRLYDLFVGDEQRRGSTPSWSASRASSSGTSAAGDAAPAARRRGARASVWTPSRVDVVERLDAEGLLPAITFIFSRAGCDARGGAVPALGAAADRAGGARRGPRVRRAARCADIPPTRTSPCSATPSGCDGPRARHRRAPRRHAADLQGGRRGAVRPRPGQGGVRHRDAGARHQHAGAVGRPRAAGEVERRDPRRRHAGGVHPADRPGRPPRHRRRGPRRRGVAPGLEPESLAGLASTRTYPLRSSFRPSYNMAVNLVGQFGRDRARALLETSFAQFQADRAVVGLARQVRTQRGGARRLPRGDDVPPRRLHGVRRAAPRARRPRGRARPDRRGQPPGRRPTASLERLRPGDVILVPAGRRARPRASCSTRASRAAPTARGRPC